MFVYAHSRYSGPKALNSVECDAKTQVLDWSGVSRAHSLVLSLAHTELGL